MILAGRPKYWEKNLSEPLCPSQISHGLTWEGIWSFKIQKVTLELLLKTQSVPRSKHTPSQLYKPVS
jgi:hypothetical protein